jgi:hypothetical protein
MRKKYLEIALMSIAVVGLLAGTGTAGTFSVEFDSNLADGYSVHTSGNAALLADISGTADPLSGDSQTQGMWGAGFTMMGTNTIEFNADLYTWDSYSDPSQGGSTGWWDAFVVNLNQTDYYWNLNPTDPLAPGYTGGGSGVYTTNPLGQSWVWGGQTYGDSLETFDADITTWLSLTLAGFDPTKKVYVSVVLDTQSLANSDTSYPSWGNFDVKVVPEPGTMLLFGAGLAGIAGVTRRKKK